MPDNKKDVINKAFGRQPPPKGDEAEEEEESEEEEEEEMEEVAAAPKKPEQQPKKQEAAPATPAYVPFKFPIPVTDPYYQFITTSPEVNPVALKTYPIKVDGVIDGYVVVPIDSMGRCYLNCYLYIRGPALANFAKEISKE